MVMERRVNPDCVNASNPFHVCAEYCVERAQVSKPRSPGSGLAGKGGRREEGRRIVVSRRNVDPSCPNASNPFHQCAEYCSPRNSEVKRQNEEKKSVQNAMEANNGRKMDEESEHTEGGRLAFTSQNGVKGKEVQMITVAARKVDPSCRNAINPFHVCSEYCFPRKAEVKRQNEKRSGENVLKLESNRVVDPTCANASNPCHVRAEYCFRRKGMEHAEGSKSAQNVERYKEHRGVIAERNTDPLCLNAYNPYHQCAEYCSCRKAELTREEEKGSAKDVHGHEEDPRIVAAKRNIHPLCPNASNPYHQCADYCLPKQHPVTGRNDKRTGPLFSQNCIAAAETIERQKEDLEIVDDERSIDPSTSNAFNQYHQCAENYSPKILEAAKQDEEKRSVKSDATIEGSRMVDPRCVNASNPYHVCAEYCLQRKEMEHAEGSKSVTGHKARRGGFKTVEREGVLPNCANASNPYHKCAEYCFQKINQLT